MAPPPPPPPSQLSIATSSLQRLVREEASYHRELEMQRKSIARLEERKEAENKNGNEDEEEEEEGNREFLLRQEKRACEETQAVFPRLRERIREAMANLEALLVSAEEGDAGAAKAREVIEQAKAATG